MVTPLNKKRAGRLNISDEIKQQLTDLEVPLNSTLIKTIRAASVEIVLNAIEAFKEAMVTDNIEKPGAWLKSAIEDGWRKNKPHSCEITTRTTNEFSEWFELAYQQGVALAKQETEEDLMIQDTTGQWMPWKSFVERGWTLEYLRKRAKAK